MSDDDAAAGGAGNDAGARAGGPDFDAPTKLPPAADQAPAVGAPSPPPAADRPKPSKAERLEAKAAKLREEADRRAAAAASGALPDGRPFVVATSVLGVVSAVLAALLLVTFLAWQDAKDDKPGTHTSSAPPTGSVAPSMEQARDAALAAAKEFAVDFGSYDYQHLDTEFQEVAAKMTPSFAKSYLETSGKLKPTFVQYKTRVTARLQGYGVTSASPTDAVVVVFLDQTVRTSQSSTPRIDRNRLEIHLVNTAGTWLVSKLLAK